MKSPAMSGVQWLPWLLVVLAIAQALWLLASGAPAPQRAVGFLLGITSVAAMALRRLPDRSRVRVLSVLALAIATNLALFILANAAPIDARMLLLIVLVGYVAAGAAGVLPAHHAVKGLVAVLVAAGPLLVLESRLTDPTPTAAERTAVDSARAPAAPRPARDGFYAANTVEVVGYPNNPRRYFDSPDVYRPTWQLYTHDSLNIAELVRDEERPDWLMVRTEKAAGKVGWHIQLKQDSLPVRAGGNYQLVYRVKASTPRLIGVGVWGSLGTAATRGMLYRTVTADGSWRSYAESFRATVTDMNVLLHFDLGEDTAGVELSDVAILDQDRSIPVRQPREERFTLSYRFNNLGCRGDDVSVHREPGSFRILSLGDSHTLGAGVRDEDSYSARLQRILNDPRADRPSKARYEVINCGATGFGTADARLFFERTGKALAPDVVLLAVAPGDDRGSLDDVGRSTAEPPRGIEHLLLSLWRLRGRRAGGDAPRQDVTAIVDEVRQLRKAGNAANARLAVVVFDDEGAALGDQLGDAVAEAFRQSDVSVLRLSEVLPPLRPGDRVVDSLVDLHPNEVVHRLAANALLRFLRAERLLAPEDWDAPATATDSTRKPG